MTAVLVDPQRSLEQPPYRLSPVRQVALLPSPLIERLKKFRAHRHVQPFVQWSGPPHAPPYTTGEVNMWRL